MSRMYRCDLCNKTEDSNKNLLSNRQYHYHEACYRATNREEISIKLPKLQKPVKQIRINSEEFLSNAKQLFDAGKNLSEIARETNVSLGHLRRKFIEKSWPVAHPCPPCEKCGKQFINRSGKRIHEIIKHGVSNLEI